MVAYATKRLARISAVASCLLVSTGSWSQSLLTVGPGNTLVTIGAAAPTTIIRSTAITGLAAGTTLGGIDYRPASPRVLYGLSNVGQLYAINARTGAASMIGAPAVATVGGIGVDFNPTVDRIRIVTQIGQNARLNPDSGALAATDGFLAYAPTDANAGSIVTAAGAAYTNNVAGATSTTLYVIDTRSGLAAARLVTQGNATVSPNSGALFTVGSTGVTTTGSVGFDISREGTAYATLTNPTTGVTSLYTVNLATGAATLVGALAGNTTYNGLAVQLASFTSMGATANQAALGTVLDNFAGLPTGGALALINGVDSVFATPGAQSAALLSLTPAAYSLLPDISLNAVEVQESVIGQVAGARRGVAMADGNRALIGHGKVAAWISGGLRYGRYDAAVDRYRTETDEYHFLGGADYQLLPNAAIGLFGGYSSTSALLGPNRSHGGLQAGFGGGYATGSVGPVVIDAWGSYTDLRWGVARGVAAGTFSEVNSTRTKGRIYAGGAKVGFSYDLAGFAIEPFAAVRYADVGIDGFTEAGGASALTVSRFDRTSVRSHLGGKAAGTFDLAGATIKPGVYGGWYHEFKGRTDTISASFTNATFATPFAFATTPLSRGYYNVGAKIDMTGSAPVALFAGYDVQFDKARRFNTATLGVHAAF